MEKNILVSGKELKQMHICPECSERGFIEETFYALGCIESYKFKCGCGCVWECTSELYKHRVKEIENKMNMNNFIEYQKRSWHSRLFRR